MNVREDILDGLLEEDDIELVNVNVPEKIKDRIIETVLNRTLEVKISVIVLKGISSRIAFISIVLDLIEKVWISKINLIKNPLIMKVVSKD